MEKCEMYEQVLVSAEYLPIAVKCPRCGKAHILQTVLPILTCPYCGTRLTVAVKTITVVCVAED